MALIISTKWRTFELQIRRSQKSPKGENWFKGHVNLSLSKHDPANHKLEGSNHKDCDLYRP